MGLGMVNTRNIRARLYIEDDDEFVEDIVLDRDAHEYPDPYLRPLTTEGIFEQYLNRVETAIANYEPATEEEAEECFSFLQRERNRVNGRLTQLRFPAPSEKDISTEFVKEIENANTNERDIWMRVMSCSLSELRYLSAYFHVHDNYLNDRTCREALTIDAIRFVKGDSTVSIDGLMNFMTVDEFTDYHTIQKVETGEELELNKGPEFDMIKETLTDIIFNSQSLIFAIALSRVKEVTNYYHEDLPNGMYDGRKMNFSKPIGHNDESAKMERSIIAHEFFHSVQNVMGAIDHRNNDYVDLSAEPNEWEIIQFFDEPENSPFFEPQKRMKELWFKFRQGEIEPLCEYQTKNIHEMYAVAFEAYYTEPDVLKTNQPDVYELIDTIVNI